MTTNNNASASAALAPVPSCISEDNEVLMSEVNRVKSLFEGTLSSSGEEVIFFILQEEIEVFISVCRRLSISPDWRGSFVRIDAHKCFWASDDEGIRWFIWLGETYLGEE